MPPVSFFIHLCLCDERKKQVMAESVDYKKAEEMEERYDWKCNSVAPTPWLSGWS